MGGTPALSRVVGTIFSGLTRFVVAMPAQAGMFEDLFSGLSRAFHEPPRLPDAVREFAAPIDPRSERAIDPSGQAMGGPARAFCVRTCDGHYFPVLAHPGLSAAEACHAFCPASQTAVFAGGSIDYAVAANGSRYADLPNAFVYRKHLVAGCTCNGRDQFGLAHIDINNDPTLRPGDVVSAGKTMVAFAGRRNQTAQFTPAGNYSRFSRDYRGQLSAMENSAPR